MSHRIDQMAQSIADLVSGAVTRARYSQPHIGEVAHRAAYLAAHHYLSVLEAEATGKPVEADQAAETAGRYDKKRKAEQDAGMRAAFEAAKAARKQALEV